MAKEEHVNEIIRDYANKKDWISIDILCQRAFRVEAYYLEKNLRLAFPGNMDFNDKMAQIDNVLKNIGYEDTTCQFILREIDKVAGKQLRENVIENIKKADESITNGLFLFADIWSKKLNELSIELNKLYYSTFGKDPSFDLAKELVTLGICYYNAHSSRKNSWWYYHTPPYVIPILQNVGKYIQIPKLFDISSYIEKEKQNNNIARLMFLDLSTRKVNSTFVDNTPNLKENVNLHYPEGFDDSSYSKAGVVYVDEYGKAYFSPVTISQLKTEIKELKRNKSESLKKVFLNILSKFEKKYAPIAQTHIRFDKNLGAYIGTIDVGTKKPLGFFVSPWVLWVKEPLWVEGTYYSEIHYDLEYIKKNLPCIIVTSDKIRPSVIRKAILQGDEGVSFISISDTGNYLLSIGTTNKIVTELLPIFTEEGLPIEDITEKVLSRMFPFTPKDVLNLANTRFSKAGLIGISAESGINLSKSMLKDDMLQALCDHMGMRGFAQRIGYPLFEKEVAPNEVPIPPEVKRVVPPPPPVDPGSKTVGESIIIGSKDFPKQYGIIGLHEKKKVIIDLNAPHIVFVSGIMGAGKGYTIGTISEMLVSNGIQNISNVSKQATIIVLYKPRDNHVPSEFWSIRYPNDVPKEIDALRNFFNTSPVSPITENQFRVFIDPGVYVTQRDMFKSDYNTQNINPLYIDPSTLINEDWANALATGGTSDALYVKKIYSILRKLSNDFPNFSMDDIRNSITDSDLTKAQKGLAFARLEILADYLQKEDFVKELILGGVNIIDFRNAMYKPDDVFTIMTLIMSKLQNKKELENEPFVFIMNEAHLYFREGISKEFVDTIENLIRRKRHGANWLLLDTHLPDDVDLKIIQLSDIKVFHFTDKTVDSRILRSILEGTDAKLSELKIGEAIICANESSLGPSKSIRIQVRPRVSKHGGATKTATKED